MKVTCRWLSGDETILNPCDLVGHVRAQVCAMKERVWAEVVLLDMAYEPVDDDTRSLSTCAGPTAVPVRDHEDLSMRDADNDGHIDHVTGHIPESILLICVLKDAEPYNDTTWCDMILSHIFYGEHDVRWVFRALVERNTTSVIPDGALNLLWRSSISNRTYVIPHLVRAEVAVPEFLLHRTVIGENARAVAALILANASVNAQNSREMSPLHFAATSTSGHRTTIFASLLHARADANLKDNMGRTALHRAVLSENAESVSALVAATHVDERNSFGWTALHSAAKLCCAEIIEILAVKKADVNITDSEGRTPLHIAALGRDGGSAIEPLLKHGADARVVTTRGLSAWHLANISIVKGSRKQSMVHLLEEAASVRESGTGWDSD
eukprot:GEMP01048586.1.p1 GENE.GEMP01048586.1~~GEMP01048586.1.p1  ORF type:complete len:383 (+),score=100.94 GEMP01048586.1:27-1175(+)